MSTKPIAGPITLRAASLTLAASSAFTDVKGTVSTDQANGTTGAVRLGQMNVATVRMSYTRNGSSSTGAPIVRVYGSLDATTTAPAAVANWQPIMILGSTFSAGQIDVYPEAQALLPSAAGTTTFGTHAVDVSLFNWLLVAIADQDGTNFGSVANVVLGGTL